MKKSYLGSCLFSCYKAGVALYVYTFYAILHTHINYGLREKENQVRVYVIKMFKDDFKENLNSILMKVTDSY